MEITFRRKSDFSPRGKLLLLSPVSWFIFVQPVICSTYFGGVTRTSQARIGYCISFLFEFRLDEISGCIIIACRCVNSTIAEETVSRIKYDVQSISRHHTSDVCTYQSQVGKQCNYFALVAVAWNKTSPVDGCMEKMNSLTITTGLINFPSLLNSLQLLWKVLTQSV